MESCDYDIAQDGKYRVIRLDNKDLKEYPKEIKLDDFDGIDLSHNLLDQFPKILIIQNLRAIYLLENQLTGLPEDIGQNLEKLTLGFNQFSYFPDALLKIKSLKELDLSGNAISKLPKLIHCLTNLELLNLRFMKCKVSIPPEIIKLKKLKKLNIDQNSITTPRTTPKKQPLSLFEICADHVLRNKLIKQNSILPKEIEFELKESKEACHHCDGSFLKKLSITVIREVVIGGTTINTQAYFCSEKCRQAWEQTMSI